MDQRRTSNRLYACGGALPLCVAGLLCACAGPLSRSDLACMSAHLACVTWDAATSEAGINNGNCIEANILFADPNGKLNREWFYTTNALISTTVAIGGELAETVNPNGREWAHCSYAAIRCSAGIWNTTNLEACW